MDNTIKPPSVLSLCSGYGGLELGLKRVFGEISVLAHVEIEAFAIANLVNKMETGQMVPAPIWSDLKTFRSKMFRGHVDILTGGYPCQPFSTSGGRKGEEDPRHLWPYIGEIIDECDPTWVFFENVEGHLTKGVVQVLADLEAMAYRVECGVFSAEEVGAPHQRKRVFILGKLADSRGQGLQKCPQQKEVSRTPGGELPIRLDFSWPSRPGEVQSDWEEPRVVDSKSSEWRRPIRENDAGRRSPEVGGPNGADGSLSETKPRLGGAVNGLTHRVDRLRLLGNGVVPQVAEKAFRTLHRRLTQ